MGFIPLAEAIELQGRIRAYNQRHWKREVLARGLPSCVPLNPSNAYKGRPGWKGAPRFFRGSSVVKRKKLDKCPYEQAQEWAIKMGCRNSADWHKRVKFLRPAHIPGDPNAYYRATGEWREWRHFCGKERYYSWEEACQVVKSWGVANRDEFAVKAREDERMPNHPESVYASYWTDWGRSYRTDTVDVRSLGETATRRLPSPGRCFGSSQEDLGSVR